MNKMCNVCWRVGRAALNIGFVLFVVGCNQIKTEDANRQLELLRELQSASEASGETDQWLMSQLEEITERQGQLETLVTDLKQQVAANQQSSALPKKSLKKAPLQAAASANEPQEERSLRGKSLLGRVEWLWLPGFDRYFAAQLDTAIDHSLIFAESVTPFEREGKSWVRFTVERSGKLSEIEAAVLRSDKFSYPGSKLSTKGPVVSLPAELSEYSDAIEFIVLPSKTSYPQIVLGRNFLTDVAVVDVSRKYVFSREPGKLKLEAAKLTELSKNDAAPDAQSSKNGRSE